MYEGSVKQINIDKTKKINKYFYEVLRTSMSKFLLNEISENTFPPNSKERKFCFYLFTLRFIGEASFCTSEYLIDR